MSYRRIDTLLACARRGYWVRLTCSCGHVAEHNPMVIVELLLKRGGSTHLKRLNQSMKCGRCGGKDFTATHCNGPEIWNSLRR